MTLAIPTPRPCPSWCQLPAGHDLDDPAQLDRDGTLNVRHLALLAEAGDRVEVEQSEFIGGPHPEIAAPVVLVNGWDGLTADQARHLARGYALAAEILGG